MFTVAGSPFSSNTVVFPSFASKSAKHLIFSFCFFFSSWNFFLTATAERECMLLCLFYLRHQIWWYVFLCCAAPHKSFRLHTRTINLVHLFLLLTANRNTFSEWFSFCFRVWLAFLLHRKQMSNFQKVTITPVHVMMSVCLETRPSVIKTFSAGFLSDLSEAVRLMSFKHCTRTLSLTFHTSVDVKVTRGTRKAKVTAVFRSFSITGHCKGWGTGS